jgi:hypothetical protein
LMCGFVGGVVGFRDGLTLMKRGPREIWASTGDGQAAI